MSTSPTNRQAVVSRGRVIVPATVQREQTDVDPLLGNSYSNNASNAAAISEATTQEYNVQDSSSRPISAAEQLEILTDQFLRNSGYVNSLRIKFISCYI